MADATSLVGLGPHAALGRLLAERDLAASLATLMEACGPDPGPDLMAQYLESRGVQARATRAEAERLGNLDLPTLLLLKDGGWAVLREARPNRMRLEGAAGPVELDGAAFREAYAGVALDLLPDLPPGTLWTRLLQLLYRNRRAFYPIFAVMVVVQLLNLVTPLLTAAMVDKAFPQGARSIFRIVLVGTVLMSFFEAWLAWLQQLYTLYIETRLNLIMERGLLNHLLRLPFAFLQGKTVGELYQAFGGFSTAKDLLTGEALGSLLGGVTAVSYLVLMARLMPAATVFVLIMSLATGVGTLLIAYYQVRIQRVQIQTESAYRSYMVELFSGMPTIKAAGAEDRVLDTWLRLLRENRFVGLWGQRLNLTSGSALAILGLVQSQVLLIWGGRMVLDGQLQLGELLAFNMMSGSFQGAIQGFFSAGIRVWMARPYLEIAREFVDREALPPPPLVRTRALDGPIVVEDLWFRYTPDGPWVIEGMNLTVHPGEQHQIHGPSGSGKSTLLKLVAGLYTPERGSIRIGGLAPEQARHLCIYLPQFVQLTSGTIMENLKLLSGGAERARLEEAAETTGLAGLIAGLPMGYDTLIAASGTNFSGGQRQLIALTAVLASERPLLLLDEAMANLDSVRRLGLMRGRSFKDKTILFASHDGGLGT